jgi:hypothetical protein
LFGKRHPPYFFPISQQPRFSGKNLEKRGCCEIGNKMADDVYRTRGKTIVMIRDIKKGENIKIFQKSNKLTDKPHKITQFPRNQKQGYNTVAT